MKVVFKAEDLKKAVSRCVKYTNPKGFLSEYNYLCFNGDSLMATDGVVGIIHAIQINFGENRILVPADIFHKAIIALEGQDIEVTIRRGVAIKAGGFKTKFQEIDASGYTSFEVPQEGIKDIPKDFMADIKQIRFSVSSDSNKPEMMGVYFDGSHFYSTDNYRITRFALGEPVEERLLIPNTLLSLIVSEGEPNGYCLEESKGRIWFFYDEFIVFGKLLEGEFPNCGTVFETLGEKINANEMKKVAFDRANVAKALERLSMFKIEAPNRTDLVIQPGVLYLLVAGEGVEAIEKLPAETAHSGLFSVSLNFLKDAVNGTECFFFPDQGLKAPLFFQSQTGLETLLLPLEVGDAETNIILARVGEQMEEADPTECSEPEVEASKTAEASEGSPTT